MVRGLRLPCGAAFRDRWLQTWAILRRCKEDIGVHILPNARDANVSRCGRGCSTEGRRSARALTGCGVGGTELAYSARVVPGRDSPWEDLKKVVLGVTSRLGSLELRAPSRRPFTSRRLRGASSRTRLAQASCIRPALVGVVGTTTARVAASAGPFSHSPPGRRECCNRRSGSRPGGGRQGMPHTSGCWFRGGMVPGQRGVLSIDPAGQRPCVVVDRPAVVGLGQPLVSDTPAPRRSWRVKSCKIRPGEPHHLVQLSLWKKPVPIVVTSADSDSDPVGIFRRG